MWASRWVEWWASGRVSSEWGWSERMNGKPVVRWVSSELCFGEHVTKWVAGWMSRWEWERERERKWLFPNSLNFHLYEPVDDFFPNLTSHVLSVTCSKFMNMKSHKMWYTEKCEVWTDLLVQLVIPDCTVNFSAAKDTLPTAIGIRVYQYIKIIH
jgi:hypothetical protein